tara:strand:+ start:766 stop:1047 length:282 start_codon:yes stop_codon:yes gene_type:complete
MSDTSDSYTSPNDNLYLQLAEQSKKKFFELENEIKYLKKEINDKNKIIMTLYGNIRLLDNIIDNDILHYLNAFISRYIDEKITYFKNNFGLDT